MKEKQGHPHTAILHGNKKGSTDACSSMDACRACQARTAGLEAYRIIWLHVNGILEKTELQAQKSISGFQAMGVEEGVWWHMAQGNILLYFYCGGGYTTVYACQNSTNCPLKGSLLLYEILSQYLWLFFKKEKELLGKIFKYWLPYPPIPWFHKYILFRNSLQTGPSASIPHVNGQLHRTPMSKHRNLVITIFATPSPSPQVQILAEFCPFYFPNTWCFHFFLCPPHQL